MTTAGNNPKRTSAITLRQEKNPTRCEICHQSDVFNRETGFCQRCQPVLATLPEMMLPPTPLQPQGSLRWRFIVSGCLILAGFCFLIAAGLCSNNTVEGLPFFGFLVFVLGTVCLFVAANYFETRPRDK
ncbi:MAG: hypothetical protein K1Y36_14390 [Blastocatellia bacterium]|nr:hypothetical protein [Blastocatellia bacterium]